MFEKEVNEDFTILIISSGFTSDVVSNQIMIKTIKSYKPSYWRSNHPDGFFVYFCTSKKRFVKRANKLYQAISKLIIRNNNFENYTIGKNKGRFSSELSLFGKAKSEPQPLDNAINKAYYDQKDRSDLMNQA